MTDEPIDRSDELLAMYAEEANQAVLSGRGRLTVKLFVVQPSSEQSGSLLDGIMTAAELDAMTFPALVEHVPTLIPEGFGVLAGSPKIGKSWLVNGLALACAQGGIALGGIDVAARRVLLLALEDGPRRLQDRMRRLNYNQPLPARLDIKTVCTPGTVLATITEWLDMRGNDVEPPLVILDTIGRARPQRRPGDDPYIADYQLGSRIKACIDSVSGAALLAVHHTRKASADDWVETISGTNGVTGSADYVLALTRKRQTQQGVLSVTGRDVAENEYALKIDLGIWTLDGSTLDDASDAAETRIAVARLGDAILDVLTVVKESDELVTPAMVAAKLGIDPKTASKYLTRLDYRGDIIKSGRGKYVSKVSKVSKGVEGSSEVDTFDSSSGDENRTPISDYDTYDTFDTTSDDDVF